MSTLQSVARAAIVAVALLLCPPSPCIAQDTDSDSAAALGYRDRAMRLINAVLDVFWEVMSEDERAVLQEIDVRMPVDYNITRAVAYRDDSGRVIEVSSGFFGMMSQLCEDDVLREYYLPQDPGINDKFEQYLTSLNQAIDHNEQSFSVEPEPLPRFAPFAGIPDDVAAEIEGRDDYVAAVGNLRMSAIAFVLAHEIGHHLLGHTDRPSPETAEQSRAEETEADRYAGELTLRAGLPAFGAFPALVFFAAAEGETLDPEASHPLAMCRVLDTYLDIADWLAADERLSPLLDLEPDMRPGHAKYQQLVADKQQYCS